MHEPAFRWRDDSTCSTTSRGIIDNTTLVTPPGEPRRSVSGAVLVPAVEMKVAVRRDRWNVSAPMINAVNNVDRNKEMESEADTAVQDYSLATDLRG